MPKPIPPTAPQSVDRNVVVSQIQDTGPEYRKNDIFEAPSIKTDLEFLNAKERASSELERSIQSADPSRTTLIQKNVFTPYITQAQSEAEAATLKQQQLKDTMGKPNVLDSFANYTYHIVFSMIKQNSAYTINANTDLNTVERIIIAESGATVGYNISNFVINNTVSPSFQQQNQAVTQWTMTLTEPYGMTFPDYVLLAAQQLDISNSAKFPFFIELWFTGYDESGTVVQPKVTRKIWRVMMLDFDLTTNETGTVYNINGIVDNDIGTANQFSLPPSTIVLNNVTTFGSAMTDLEKKLNETTKKAENKDTTATVYKIILPTDTDISTWAIDDVPENSQASKSTNGIGFDITLNSGQDISLFIMSVLAKCGTAADRFLRGNDPSNTSPDFDKNGLGRVLKIITEVKLEKYNEILNDYSKTITYKLVPFTTTRTVRDPDEARKLSDPQLQLNKLQYLVNKNLLAKKYEYIYTGKNTSVIKFDVHVENFWAITLPTFLSNRTYGQATNGAVAATNSPYANEVQGFRSVSKTNEKVIAQAIASDQAASGASSGAVSPFEFSQIKSKFTSLNPSINDLANGSALLNNLYDQAAGAASKVTNAANMNTIIQSLSNTTKTVAGSELAKSIKQFTNLSVFNFTPIATFDNIVPDTVQNLISNIGNVSSDSFTKIGAAAAPAASASNDAANIRRASYLEDIKTQTGGDPLLVSFMIDNEPKAQNSVNNGAEAKNKPSSSTPFAIGQSMWAQTIGNLYDNTFMLEIDLEIRGDPWWLGLTNLEENQQLFNTTLDDRANYTIGENMFLLTFKTGSVYDEQTGLMDFNQRNDYFNGIYVVLEVENRFENGAFTQKLKAYKELFSQKVSANINETTVFKNESSQSSVPQRTVEENAAIATGTAPELVTSGGAAFGPGGLTG